MPETVGPTLSIVIAVWNDDAGLAEALEGVLRQADPETEVLVVSNVDLPPPLPDDPKRIRWIRKPDDALVPQLWSAGIAAATGRVVAVTTSHFTPEPGWVRAVLAAHQRSPAAGIGGRIEPPRGRGAVAWATYFLRYSDYFGWDTERAVTDIAGDNASYKRDALQAHWPTIAGGFWEPDFHARVLAEGGELRFVPEIRMRQHTSYGFLTFCRQRLDHGMHFGSERIRGRSSAERAMRVASAPLIPAVFLGKIAMRVIRSGRDFGPFLGSFPVLAAFVLAWVTGEVSGYWHGPGAESREGV